MQINALADIHIAIVKNMIDQAASTPHLRAIVRYVGDER
jgi:hypothetical protein